MNITVKKYEPDDLHSMIRIWNEVVEDGIAFPQEEMLTPDSGKDFFCSTNIYRCCQRFTNR